MSVSEGKLIDKICKHLKETERIEIYCDKSICLYDIEGEEKFHCVNIKELYEWLMTKRIERIVT